MNDSDGHEANGEAPESTIEHNPMVRARGNTKSLRKAVDAFCASCMGCTVDHYEPGFKQEIRNCTATGCPLYNFRPYKKEGE